MFAPIGSMIVGVTLDSRDATTFAHAAQVVRAFTPETVYLLHIVEPSRREGVAQAAVGPAEDAATRQRLQALASTFELPPGTHTELVVAHGDVIPTLLKHAGKSSADLIVIGRSTDNRADESTRGAVRVLRKIPCSVLIVPEGAPADYDRVVVAADFSNRSGEALELAARLAAPGSAITALHVVAPPLGYHKLGQSFDEAAAAVRDEAERESAQWLPSLDLGGVTVAAEYTVGEDVPQAIADHADETRANLVVVASHGRTQPAALLLGHVADSVCRKVSCPMLCVKRKGEVVDLIHAIAQLYEWD